MIAREKIKNTSENSGGYYSRGVIGSNFLRSRSHRISRGRDTVEFTQYPHGAVHR